MTRPAAAIGANAPSAITAWPNAAPPATGSAPSNGPRSRSAPWRTRYGCRLFHLSQDSLSPKTARRLAEALKSALNGAPGEKPPVRWATDMRPEPALDAECCRALAEGGALGVALGVESAAPRVLKLIHKGLKVKDAASAVKNLAAAGIAVEVMCFTDFPTETGREALMTARFIEELRESIALFICGEFALVAGARVAQHPGEYGIRETWHVAGDEFLTDAVLRGIGPRQDPGRSGKDRRRRGQARAVVVAAPVSLGRFALHGAHPALV